MAMRGAVPSTGRPGVVSRAEAALRRIVADLHGLGRRFVLVGGLPVSAQAEPRFTRDADLAVLVGGCVIAQPHHRRASAGGSGPFSKLAVHRPAPSRSFITSAYPKGSGSFPERTA